MADAMRRYVVGFVLREHLNGSTTTRLSLHAVIAQSKSLAESAAYTRVREQNPGYTVGITCVMDIDETFELTTDNEE